MNYVTHLAYNWEQIKRSTNSKRDSLGMAHMALEDYIDVAYKKHHAFLLFLGLPKLTKSEFLRKEI